MGESFQPGAWSVEMEVNLFHAMRSHKPVGKRERERKGSGEIEKKFTQKDA